MRPSIFFFFFFKLLKKLLFLLNLQNRKNYDSKILKEAVHPRCPESPRPTIHFRLVLLNHPSLILSHLGTFAYIVLRIPKIILT